MALPSKRAFNLRLLDPLRDRSQKVADLQGVSLNSFIVTAIENYLPYAEKGVRYQLREAVKRDRELAEAQALAAKVSKVGANQRCPCGSGKKYRHCHGSSVVP